MADKKDLTDKQKKVLELLPELDWNGPEAVRQAGYKSNNATQVLRALKQEIVELAADRLALLSNDAVTTVENIMKSETPIPQAAEKGNMAKTVLDRVGLGKQDSIKLDVQGELGGLFILPAKEEA